MSASQRQIRQLAPRSDPTNTASISQRYAQRLRGWLGRLNATIRESIRSEDSFNIRREALQDIDPPPVFRFERDIQKRNEFLRWLREQENRGILEIISRDDNRFIRSAYQRSLEDADRLLNAEGVTVPERELEELFNQPIHQRALEDLFTRNFENLEDITSEMNSQISEELTRGFARGQNPTTIARNITDRVNKVGKHRATLLARTETINSYSEAHLNRFERMGVRQVTIRAEWLTAGDDRVCPICQALEGESWSIQEARRGTIRLSEGDVAEFVPDNLSTSSFTGSFPVKPPSHPMCRCRLIPEVIN